MSWSELIFRFVEEGSSHEDIIKYFSNPIVNEKYIVTALDTRRRLLRRRKTYITKPRIAPPLAGSGKRKVYDYAQSIGGIKALMELLKHQTRVELAKKLGVPTNTVGNFVRDYWFGRHEAIKWLGGYPNLTVKMQMEKFLSKTKYTPKKKRVAMKDARKLW